MLHFWPRQPVEPASAAAEAGDSRARDFELFYEGSCCRSLSARTFLGKRWHARVPQNLDCFKKRTAALQCGSKRAVSVQQQQLLRPAFLRLNRSCRCSHTPRRSPSRLLERRTSCRRSRRYALPGFRAAERFSLDFVGKRAHMPSSGFFAYTKNCHYDMKR